MELTHPIQQRVSLVNLPPEVLFNICSYFCDHCHDDPHRDQFISWADGDFHHDVQSMTLRNLNFTCRYLRDIAQPILHHRFRFHTRQTCTWLHTPLLRLLRTLHERPDLRSHVSLLDIQGHFFPCGCDEPTTPPDVTDEQIRLTQALCEETGLSVDSGNLTLVRGDRCSETLLQVLLTILPNLSELQLLVSREWEFDAVRKWRAKSNEILGGDGGHVDGPSVPRPTPASFMGAIQKLQLYVDRFHLDACVSSHNGCNKPCGICPAQQVLIAAAAPHVRHLSCTDSGLTKVSRLPNLTHVEVMMTGFWPEGRLNQVLSRECLPALTHFSYSSINEHAPTPREVQNALELSLSDQLEYLHMSIDKHMTLLTFINGHDPPWSLDDRWAPPANRDFVLGPFHDRFPQLRTLSVDDYMIWHDDLGHPVTPHHDWVPERDMFAFLPPAVETVFVEGCVGLAPPLMLFAWALQKRGTDSLRQMVWSDKLTPKYHVMDTRHMDNPGWLRGRLWMAALSPRDVHYVVEARRQAFLDWTTVLDNTDMRRVTDATA